MKAQMDLMIENLKSVENIEQLADLENEIASTLGNGFLKGQFNYSYMENVKEAVEQIETERREQFLSAAELKCTSHVR